MKKTLVCALVLVGCGSDGRDGNDGQNGLPGVRGEKGETGATGTAGVNGKDGKSFAAAASELVNKIQPLVKNVLDIECVSGGWRGTGTKLTDGSILTARHVVQGCTSIAYYSQGLLVGLGGIYSQSGRDVSKISSINWNSSGAALSGISVSSSTSRLAVGDLTATVSHPLELVVDAQITLGFVTDALLEDAPSMWSGAFLTDAAAAAGSSGAPVFNASGDLVAIHVGGWSNGGLELNIQLPINP